MVDFSNSAQGSQIPQQNWTTAPTAPDLSQYISNLNPNQINQLTTDQLIARYRDLSGAPQNLQNLARQNYNDLDRLNQTAYDEMRSQLGRDPTTQEWNQLYQAFQGPNGVVNGRAAVSSYAQQLQRDPTNPLSPLNPNNAAYQKTLSPYNDQVSKEFQSLVGRAPTTAELQHYAGGLASGATDLYGVDAALKQLPEYTNAQDTQFRNSLNDQLQGYDTAEFNREKGDVMAQYAKNGMNPGVSPSLDYALTDLMGRLSQNRSAYLAQLSASQYGGNKDLATANYQNTLGQMYANNQNQRQQQQSMNDYYMQRGNQGADYYTQMNDYLKFMNQNKSSYNPLYGAVGGAIGAGVGAYAGGPAGAGAGYQVGSGLGNGFNYLNF